MLSRLLDVLNSAAFSIGSAPVSWAELIGAALGVAMVLCNIRQIHWGWPLNFLSSMLYVLVFSGVKLFGEAALQVFFAATALWGWTQWLRHQQGFSGQSMALRPRRLDKSIATYFLAITLMLTAALGIFLSQFTASDVPWWDAVPTALSLAATWLLAKKYIENWPLWIVVNLISMALFAFKGLWLTVGLYGVFAVLAAVGWRAWQRELARA
jgi:nicotinamide mononucleotide transporter